MSCPEMDVRALQWETQRQRRKVNEGRALWGPYRVRDPNQLTPELAPYPPKSLKRTGAAYRTRTCDPLITNEVLYQLS
jgi:hypothetical protein